MQTSRVSRRSFLELGLKTLAGGLAMTTLQVSGPAFAAAGDSSSTFPRGNRFQVGEFLKFRRYRDAAGRIQVTRDYLPDAWFEALGLVPVDVVYQSRFLAGSDAAATLDADRLQRLAAAAKPGRLVSLDAEAWDTAWAHPARPTANGKSIVQNLVDVVRTFKQANPGIQVGLYSEVPPNTYGFNATTQARFDPLTPQYAAVAAEVDYYSPSLYNYHIEGSQAGDAQWAQFAGYAIRACERLDSLNHTRKPILPYVTPAWKDSAGAARYLTQEQMHFRLATLRQLGAAGCILWLSDAAKEPDSDEPLALDPTTGWLRAAVEFAKEP